MSNGEGTDGNGVNVGVGKVRLSRVGVGVNVGVGVARLSNVGVMVGLESVGVRVGLGSVGVRVGPARIGGPPSNGGTVKRQIPPISKAAAPAIKITFVRGFMLISFG